MPSETESTHPEREYLLGTDAVELERLGYQHEVWKPVTTAGWEHGRFAPGSRLLDIGCGPGYTTLDLARLVGREGEVVGVDVSDRFAGYLRERARDAGASNVSVLVQDVARLDVPAGAFDGAYARWVLCFVPDPAAVLRGLARALRPGGRFVVHDYVRYPALAIAPPSDAFSRVIDAVVESWRASGGDPEIGLRLPALLDEAGFEVDSVSPVVRVARPGTALWSWPETFFRSYLPRLAEQGLVTQAAVDAFWQVWEARRTQAGAFFLTPPMVEIVAVRR